MISTFLDKLSGVFDRRFLIAYWSPACFGLGVVAVLVGIGFGPALILSWWKGLDGIEQALVGGGILLATIFVAYLLEALTTPVVRFFEGYWPENLLTHLARRHQETRLKATMKQLNQV